MADKRVIRLLNDLRQRNSVLMRKLGNPELCSSEVNKEYKGNQSIIYHLKEYERDCKSGSEEESLRSLYQKIHSHYEKVVFDLDVKAIDLKDPLFAYYFAERKAADVVDAIAKEKGWFEPYRQGAEHVLVYKDPDNPSKAILRWVNSQYGVSLPEVSEIQKMDDGTEYVNIRYNPYLSAEEQADDSLKARLAKRFVNRICDAVRLVKEGYADCIIGPKDSSSVFASKPKPVVLLDRYLAAQKHDIAIKGMGDLKEGWHLLYVSKNSFFGGTPVSLDGDLVVLEGTPALFDTKEDAIKFYQSLLDTAEELVTEVFESVKPSDMENSSDEKPEKSIGFRRLDALEELVKERGHTPLIEFIAQDMCDGQVTTHSRELWAENYCFEVVQAFAKIEG